MESTHREDMYEFRKDLAELSQPGGEGWYGLMLHDLHERFKRLSGREQSVVRMEVQRPEYQRVIAFP